MGLVGLVPLQYVWIRDKLAYANSQAVIVPSIAPPPVTTSTLAIGHPIRLIIPSVGIDLAIIDGSYDAKTGNWTLSSDKAQFALPTVEPNNESGNTLIYGHYKKGVLLTLPKVLPGDEAFVITDNGLRFVYTFTNAETVSPTDTSIFLYQGASRLTVQTCTGRFLQNRSLHYFTYSRYEKV